MKIFINSRIYQEKYSWIQNYLYNICSRLIKIDKKNEYYFLQTKNNKTIWNTKYIKLFWWILWAFLFDNFLINFLLKKWKDGQAIFWWPAYTLPFFKKKWFKYIVTIHDLAFLIYPDNYTFIFRNYIKFITKLAIKKADIIIAVSENTKRDILKFFPNVNNKKIVVTHLGVSEDFFSEINDKRIIKDKYFFSLTTHPKRKNIYSILDVIALNKDYFKGYKYVIAWIFDNELLEEFKLKIKKLWISNNIILFWYAGFDKLKNLFKYAEFLIYPSFYEWFWLPVLEAMASNCLVINSNNSSLPEVNPNEECLFDPLSLDDIFNKIKYILNLDIQEKQKLKEKNRLFASNFTWDKTTKETLEIFNNLIK